MNFETIKIFDGLDSSNLVALTSLVYEVLGYEMPEHSMPGPMILFPEHLLEMTDEILHEHFEEQFPDTPVPNFLSEILDKINIKTTASKADLTKIINELRHMRNEDIVIRF